jgi:hypothetical protein
MKSLYIFISFLLGSVLPVIAQGTDSLKNGLIGHYTFNATTIDQSGKGNNPKTTGVSLTKDPAGIRNGVILFKQGKTSKIEIPVDISPSKLPVVTLTAWVKTTKTAVMTGIVGPREKTQSRGFLINYDDGKYYWAANCGSDDILNGPLAVVNEWTFLAVIYDQENQAIRFIANGQLFKQSAKCAKSEKTLTVGNFDGYMDELRIYSRALTLTELEILAERKLDIDTAEFAIQNRNFKKEKKEEVELNKRYIVFSKELIVVDSVRSSNYLAVLKEGDTILVTEKVKENWYKVQIDSTKAGYLSESNITANTYAEGSSMMVQKTKLILKDIFNFTSWVSWVIAISLAIILFFVMKHSWQIDEKFYLLKLKNVKKPEVEGSKSSGTISGTSIQKPGFLERFLPFDSFPWWPMLIGVLLGAQFFTGILWDAETSAWFWSGGFSFIPSGYDRAILWILWSTSIIAIIGVVLLFLESYVIAGPYFAILRILLNLVFIAMAFLVTYYLLVLVIIILILRVVGAFLSGMGSSNYRCPSCGRTFSASSGSHVGCPHCGASLRT